MEDDKPDWDISYMDEVCTAEQKTVVKGLTANGWKATHIWEYEVGWLGVWMITDRRPTEMSARAGYLHCYVKPDGKVVRYGHAGRG